MAGAGVRVLGMQLHLDLHRTAPNLDDARDHLREALKANPRRFDAAEMYARLLMRGNNWGATWDLVLAMANEKDIPVTLYERLTMALLRMPTSVQPVATSASE